MKCSSTGHVLNLFPIYGATLGCHRKYLGCESRLEEAGPFERYISALASSWDSSLLLVARKGLAFLLHVLPSTMLICPRWPQNYVAS